MEEPTRTPILWAFRRKNVALIHEGFVRVLEMATRLNGLKVDPVTVAVETAESKAEAGTSQKEVLSQTAG